MSSAPGPLATHETTLRHGLKINKQFQLTICKSSHTQSAGECLQEAVSTSPQNLLKWGSTPQCHREQQQSTVPAASKETGAAANSF